MYRSLLVPLDGSHLSEHALPVAASLAKRSRATVHLVHVHVPEYLLIPGAVAVLDTPADLRQREAQQAYLDSTAQRLVNQGVSVTTCLFQAPVAPAVNEYAAQHAVDLTVMTTHGRGAISQLWFGSVADQLVRTLQVPVLLLRPSELAPVYHTPRPLRHILIPLDGSQLSECVIEHALELGEGAEATYTLLHVVEVVPPANRIELYSLLLSQEAQDEARKAAEAYLDGVASMLKAREITVQTAVEVGMPVEVIHTYAQQNNVDVIAMGTHGRSGFSRWYLGSTTTSLLRRETTPMLIYRPKE